MPSSLCFCARGVSNAASRLSEKSGVGYSGGDGEVAGGNLMITEDDLDRMMGPRREKSIKPQSTQRKKPAKVDEDHFHYTVAKMLNHAIAPAGLPSDDRVCWFSLEGRGRRSIYEGMRNKKRGCVAGVPDVLITYAGQAFWIELKTGTGRLSAVQQDMHGTLAACGATVAVARSLEDVMGFLVARCIPHRSVTL